MIQAPKGTFDIFGNKAVSYRNLEGIIHDLCVRFGVTELRTPTFEYTELFHRGVGETTDVVQKEMYTFSDAGDRSLTLRPEGTAPACRAYLEHGMGSLPQPVKLYYISSFYRAEKPQKGRYRQFQSFGTEYFGSTDPAADAEIIALGWELFRLLGITGVELRINSIGDRECRLKYNTELREFIGSQLDRLCPVCKERAATNPLRVLDCKEEGCKRVLNDAPDILSTLGPDCKAHFGKVLGFLKAMGIPYTVDSRIVRGLDYYTKTVFEYISSDLGSQSALGGGGRYDHLMETIGGPSVPAVGFGIGIERLLIALEAQQAEQAAQIPPVVFIGAIPSQTNFAAGLTHKLRQSGISAQWDISGRSLKAQMKAADKSGARYSLVIGDDEAASNSATLKEMATGEQTTMILDKLTEFLTRKV